VFPITTASGLNHTVSVTAEVRAAEARQLLVDFFRARR
jgi:tRNA(Arg) A34 adenosine deaminase TadA